jgi:hypothetical protein
MDLRVDTGIFQMSGETPELLARGASPPGRVRLCRGTGKPTNHGGDRKNEKVRYRHIASFSAGWLPWRVKGYKDRLFESGVHHRGVPG